MHSTVNDSSGSAEPREIKLLIVGPYPPPYGGISSHIEEIARNAGNLGISLTALSYINGEDTKENPYPITIARGRSTRGIGALARAIFRRPLRVIMLLALLFKMGWESPRAHLAGVAKALTISDTVHLDQNNMVALYGTGEGVAIPYLRALHPKVPIIYWVFAAPFIEISQFHHVQRLYKTAVENSDALAASSSYCAGAAKLLAPGLNPNVHVVYFGVDSDRFTEATSKTQARQNLDINVGEDGKIVLFLGRMEPEMGINNAMKIASTVTAQHPNVTFLLCGAKGSITDKVLNLAQSSNGQIKARVDVPFDDLPTLYAASDIVIAPTVGAHACMGVSVKEAMAVGRPIVVSNSGGLPEAIIDGQHGKIVSLDLDGNVDNNGFSEAVISLISSDEKLEDMGAACRQRFEDLFTTENMIRKVRSVLSDAQKVRAQKNS